MSRHRTYFSRQPERLQGYLHGLTREAGHADRVVPIENYTKGLMLPIERKSIEPMAARLAPGNVCQMHQPLPAKELALCLTAAELRSVTWRERTRGSMRSHFAPCACAWPPRLLAQ